jgi:hypothetical protein
VIRLAWRQFRTQAAVAAVALVALAALLAVIAQPHVVHPHITKTLTSTNVVIQNHLLDAEHLGILLLVIPALLGMFWGAPLVARELEAGTFRLVWTQSITRTRWLVVKLALVGLSSMAAAGLFSLLLTWWFGRTDPTLNPSRFSVFDERDIVPIGYAAFAFALGAVSGTLIRRTLPAMVTTLVGFVAVRLAFNAWVRPNFMSPLHTTVPFRLPTGTPTGPPRPEGVKASAWIISDDTINAAGKVIGHAGQIGEFATSRDGGLTLVGVGTCPESRGALPPPPGHPSFPALQACINHLGIREFVTYQPDSRYWTFQAYETAIYLGFALVLAGICVWWVTRGPQLRGRARGV